MLRFSKQPKILERFIQLYSLSFFIACVYFAFINLYSYVFMMQDDYVYSAAVASFLKTGQYFWAGSKPGIVLIASIFGLTSPTSIIFLYGVFGILSCIALFFITFLLLNNFYASIIPVALWLSSPFFFYFSRSHLVIYLTFYLFGIALCFAGFRFSQTWKYCLGCLLIGCSILTYYAIIFYLPFIFLFFFYYSWMQNRFFKCLFISSFFVLLPIVLNDFYAVAAYFIWGKKNWPFLYAVYGQHKELVSIPNNYSLLYFPKIFAMQEGFLISFVIAVGLVFLIISFIQNSEIKNKFLFFAMLPLLGLIIRAKMGYFSAIRPFAAIIPMIFIIVGFVAYNYLPKTWLKYFLILVLVVSTSRIIFNYTTLSRSLKTGYVELSEFLNNIPHQLIFYYGQRNLWEQFIHDKEIVPLRLGFAGSTICETTQGWKEHFFPLIDSGLNSQKKIVLIISHASKKNIDFLMQSFEERYNLKKIKDEKNPHQTSDFFVEENIRNESEFELYRQTLEPVIYIYELTKKE